MCVSIDCLNGAISLNPADPLNYERRAAIHYLNGNTEQGRTDILISKKLRWTMDDEKSSYDQLVQSSRQDEAPHMAVVRAAKAASSAAIAR